MQYPSVNIDQIMELITIHSEIIDTRDFKVSICEHTEDNKFISCAIASKCKIIVSGDKHLLKIAGYKGIQVIKPREFVEKHLE